MREKRNGTVMGINRHKAYEQTERHVERVMSALECEICVSNEHVMICLGLIGHVMDVILSFCHCFTDCVFSQTAYFTVYIRLIRRHPLHFF